MVVKRSVPERIFDVFNVLLMGILAVIFAYPMLYVLFASFSDPAQLIAHTGILFGPKGFSLDGYRMVLKTPSIWSSMGAYVLSRKGFAYRSVLTKAIVFTMYFSGGLIPFYLTIHNVGLYDTRLALILPVAINTWNLIVMRTSFSQIPESLEEAARIDGANDFVILFRVFMPVAKSTLAVMVLFYAVQHWNSWFNAMIFLQDRDKFPLQLFLREILLSGSMMDVTAGTSDDVSNALTTMMIKYCTIIVSTLPILCVYPFLQKYFAKGVMIGSVKE